MKSAVKAAALFVLLGTTLAHAQPQPGQFQHVIIVVQENRTPDNLFGGVPGANGLPPFEPGVDLAIAPPSDKNNNLGGQPWCLGSCFDPGHESRAWHSQHDSGLPGRSQNPGGCGKTPPKGTLVTYCNLLGTEVITPQPVCNSNGDNDWPACFAPYQNQIALPAWPEESYVGYYYDQTWNNGNGTYQHVLDPYVSIATQYGFANYFYQTNQGPSQPAHDFLFGGTSAPAGDSSQPYYNWFVADNPTGTISTSGCEAASGQTVALRNPDGNVYDGSYPPYQEVDLYPCFNHNTLSDLIEGSGLTWQYYSNQSGNIWTAPNGIQHICLPLDQNGNCNNSDFTNHVVPTKNFFADFPSGGTNLTVPRTHCTLPSVAWIIPDGASSDHAGFKNDNVQTHSGDIEGGPNWVASIIDAVGNAQCVEPNGKSPWYDTVILVVWDDWGGWYDHVMEIGPNGQQVGVPYQDNFFVNGQNGGDTCTPEYEPPNGQFWGCGYTYGFRVPFLVVSAYTQNVVSGACTIGANCYPPNGDGTANVDPYRHDFGSILAFIEYNFGMGVGCINIPTGRDGVTCRTTTNTNGNFPFADYYAPELQYNPQAVPLREFFNVVPSGPLGFRPIPLVNNSFTLDYFKNFNGPFTDPDNDVVDDD